LAISKKTDPFAGAELQQKRLEPAFAPSLIAAGHHSTALHSPQSDAKIDALPATVLLS
jgi:hypothetical protein